MKNMKNIFNMVFYILILSQILYAGNKIKIWNSIYNQIETTIAVNPTDPNNIIIGVINITSNNTNEWVGVFYTFDGGTQWSAIEQLSIEGAADPEIAFDEDGVAYIVYHKYSEKKVYLKKSYDGGITWPDTSLVTQNENAFLAKIAISPIRNASKHFDIYVSYTVEGNNDRGIKIKRSTDGGSSFHDFWYIDGDCSTYYDGSSIKVNANGMPVISYAELHLTQVEQR